MTRDGDPRSGGASRLTTYVGSRYRAIDGAARTPQYSGPFEPSPSGTTCTVAIRPLIVVPSTP